MNPSKQADAVCPDAKEQPAWYFFYGCLKNLELLQEVAELDDEPQFLRSRVQNMCLKFCGHFPVLIPGMAQSLESPGTP